MEEEVVFAQGKFSVLFPFRQGVRKESAATDFALILLRMRSLLMLSRCLWPLFPVKTALQKETVSISTYMLQKGLGILRQKQPQNESHG